MTGGEEILALWASIENRKVQDQNEALVELATGIVSAISGESYGEEIMPNMVIYAVDLSSLKIRGASEVAMVASYVAESGRDFANGVYSQIRTTVSNMGLGNPIIIVLCLGHSGELRRICRSSYVDITLFDREAIQRILYADEPSRELARSIRKQIGIGRASPYKSTGVVSPEMFYGRRSEMQLLLYRLDTNVAIFGCRRIGKTSLLMNAYHELARAHPRNRLFVDCSNFGDEVAFREEIISKLNPRDLVRLNRTPLELALAHACTNLNARVLLFLDEFDHLVRFDRASGWQICNALKASQAHCRTVLAGFREVFSEARKHTSPLYNFFEVRELAVLEEDAATPLVTEPMRDLGIKFRPHHPIVARILHETGRHPSFLQFYCQRLVEMVEDEQELVITEEMLDAVQAQPQFVHYVLDTFEMNIVSAEQLIAYTVVDHPEFNLEDIMEELESRNIDIELPALEGYVRNLEMANIFTMVKNGYSFSYAALPSVLKTRRSPAQMIAKLRKEVLKE